jgi:S-DNA-T family DNA segregation ATPase FtsK/SpoIIIE
MKHHESKPDTDILSRLVFIFSVIFLFFWKVIWSVLFKKSTWTHERVNGWMMYFGISLLVIYSPKWDLPVILQMLPWPWAHILGEWIEYYLEPVAQTVIFWLIPFMLWLLFLGAVAKIKSYKYQSALDLLGLKNQKGESPQVVNVISTTMDQKKILVKAVGFDVISFTNKKAVLESALNMFVQDIRIVANNRSLIDIRVSPKELPNLIPFDDVSAQLNRPFSFLVGEGVFGFIAEDLLKIHHILIAGSSGNGKSWFQKQLLIGLLKSSNHIQLYLIDLKMGVEVKAFEKLSNVHIAKNAVGAVQTLRAVEKEMDRRFQYFELKGYTEIDCKRDQLDRIVVLVDEASDLFTIVRISEDKGEYAVNARNLSDRIAKLGRAAGIHLILGTQKVVKETIDTRVQSNMTARMIFRTNTGPASVTVLGSNIANELPQVPGRGIWSVGSKDIVVQAPQLDQAAVVTKVSELVEKFNGQQKPYLQKMLLVSGEKIKNRIESVNVEVQTAMKSQKEMF